MTRSHFFISVIQAAVALSFLYLLLKLNMSISLLEDNVKTELQHKKRLENLTDSLYLSLDKERNNKLIISDVKKPVFKDSLPSVKSTDIQLPEIVSSSKSNKEIISETETLPSETPLTPPGKDSLKSSLRPSLINCSYYSNEKILLNQFQILNSINVGMAIQTSEDIHGKMIVTESKYSLRLEKINAGDNASSLLHLIAIRQQVSGDSIIDLEYQEAVDKSADEDDPRNYNKNFRIKVSGKINANELSCVLEWMDMNGHKLSTLVKLRNKSLP